MMNALSDPSRFVGESVIVGRRLARTPAFTICAVLLLGTGLGVGTTFFNLLNGLLLKHIPGSERVVRINHASSARNWSVLRADEIERVLQDPPRSFASLSGHGTVSTTAFLHGVPKNVRVDSILGRYFEPFGGVAIVGRLLGVADAGESATVVVSEHFWRFDMGADPGVVGTSLLVAERPLTIVGVVSDRFRGLIPVSTDLWVPAHVVPVTQLFGELREGVSFSEARAEVRSRYADLALADLYRGLDIEQGIQQSLPSGLYALVAVSMVLAVLVAAIAAASLTTLLLARMASNRGEIAVRLALGASTRDITRLLAIEMGLIFLVGCVVGLAIARMLATVAASRLVQVSEIRFVIDPSADWRVIALIATIGLVLAFATSGVLSGHAASVEALSSMSSAGGAGSATPHAAPLRSRLLAVQVGAVTFLLIPAALFIRSTTSSEFGVPYDTDHTVIAQLDQNPTRRDAARARTANRHALDAIRRASGVSDAALTTRLPGMSTYSTKARSEGQAAFHWVAVQGVTSRFFEVVRLPLKRGRTFTTAEDDAAADVAVVSERVAATFWPGQDPLAHRLVLPQPGGSLRLLDIIGVVTNVRDDFRNAPDSPDVFVPFDLRAAEDRVAIVARGFGPANAALDSLRAAAAHAQPPIGLLSARTVRDELNYVKAPSQLLAEGAAALGLFGLFIAAAGLYGVTAQLAVQRRRELGIRKALGATNAALCWMVAAESARTLMLGILPGIVAGVLMSFYLKQRSFHSLEPFDGLALTGVAAALLLVGVTSAVAPFRRVLRNAYAPLREP